MGLSLGPLLTQSSLQQARLDSHELSFLHFCLFCPTLLHGQIDNRITACKPGYELFHGQLVGFFKLINLL
jgi:hypothetical protein